MNIKYVGKPFTIPIAEELILELCEGETLEKKVINTRVYHEHHLKKGGAEQVSNASNLKIALQILFRDALNNLKKRGMATNVKKGIWEIMGESSPDTATDELPESCVYVYYYPAYRELADFKGEDKYPCKIGHTERGAGTRIREQVTGMPEHAIEDVIIETDNPRWLEETIRMHLKGKGWHKQDAPGDEWYLINSEIAKQIAELAEDFQKKLDVVS
ncbi:MAG: hypothetical protein OXI24_16570 [Candidatus Poribacteria bacterium]|nr:hypothetical protein [Candidatus Poribacteria bacterium]